MKIPARIGTHATPTTEWTGPPVSAMPWEGEEGLAAAVRARCGGTAAMMPEVAKAATTAAPGAAAIAPIPGVAFISAKRVL